MNRGSAKKIKERWGVAQSDTGTGTGEEIVVPTQDGYIKKSFTPPNPLTEVTKDDIINATEAVETFATFLNKISQTTAETGVASMGEVKNGGASVRTKKINKQILVNTSTLTLSCILTGAFGALALFAKDTILPQPTLFVGFVCGMITTIGLAIDGILEDRA